MPLSESLETGSGSYYPPDLNLQLNAIEPIPHTVQYRENYGALTIARRFEQNARQQPNLTALRSGESTVSYAQLNQWANQFAYRLQQHGVSANVPVCVFLDASIESVIVLLALLKLGAIYIPLDVDHPAERLNTIIADAEPIAIVTRRTLLLRLPDTTCRIVNADDTAADTPDSNPVIDVCLQQIAYIFYTSGTTGKPKGVMGTHGNLIQYVMSAIRLYAMDAATIMPAIARFTFSISLFELLAPLAAGGCVVVMPREHILDMPRLARTLEDVTQFHMGPSLLKKLLAYIDQHYATTQPFAQLRHVSSGGDSVRPSIMEGMKSIFSSADCFVIYGCSEVACMGCTYPIPRDGVVTKTLVGKPFPNVGAALFDENGQAVASGEVGEIYFCGNGITHSYLNLPELTAQKYVRLRGERFYRTGDLGRFDADGNLEILGRSDFQVKLRGIRIELGDIETHLQRIPGVIDAVVAAIDNGSGERSLCAYLVTENHLVFENHLVLDNNRALDKAQAPALDDIKNYLAQQLPDYMIPSYFVALDKLPLNFNLKIDRKALPLPDHRNLLTSHAFTAPINAIEAALVEIWRDILAIDTIGTRHDFFELGGDSLRAANLMIEVEKRFHKRIPITAFFSAPTIVEIAELIAQQQPDAPHDDLYVVRDGAAPALFLVQGALIYRELAEQIVAGPRVCVLYANEEARLIGGKSAAEFLKIYSSIETLAQRYLLAIKRQQPTGPYRLCGFSMGGLIALEIARMLQLEGAIVTHVFLLDCFVPSFLDKWSWRKIWFHARDLFSNGLPYIRRMAAKAAAIIAAKRALSVGADAQALLDSPAHIDELRRLARDTATSNYVPTRFDGHVVLFKATERVGYEPNDATLGWGELIANLDMHDVPGDHDRVLKAESAAFIAKTISDYLDGKR